MVNQHDIIAIVAEKHGVRRGDIEAVYESICNEILACLWRGESVTLNRFAEFEIVNRDAHLGRNPFSGETVEVPARRVVKVRNRSDLNKVAAVIDEAGTPILEAEEHPTIVARRERDERRAQREEERRQKAARAREVREAKKVLDAQKARAEKARLNYEAAKSKLQGEIAGDAGA